MRKAAIPFALATADAVQASVCACHRDWARAAHAENHDEEETPRPQDRDAWQRAGADTRNKRRNEMKKDPPKKILTDWDWTTLVAAWRYYEHRHTITSSMFPHEIVMRFFTGRYDDESCRRIANQFVDIDHHNGPDDRISGWVGDDSFGESDRRAWRLFYFYLFAWLYGFKTANVTLDGKSGRVEVFCADGKWYAREGYEKYGENVAPYNDSEIEWLYVEQEGAEK